jgi:hypothetical protein
MPVPTATRILVDRVARTLMQISGCSPVATRRGSDKMKAETARPEVDEAGAVEAL